MRWGEMQSLNHPSRTESGLPWDRIDLESLSRTVFLWRNDNDNVALYGTGSDPAYMQADTLGLSALAPVNNGNIHTENFPSHGAPTFGGRKAVSLEPELYVRI